MVCMGYSSPVIMGWVEFHGRRVLTFLLRTAFIPETTKSSVGENKMSAVCVNMLNVSFMYLCFCHFVFSAFGASCVYFP